MPPNVVCPLLCLAIMAMLIPQDVRSIPADQRIAYINRLADRAGKDNVRPHYQKAAAAFEDIFALSPDMVRTPDDELRRWESVAYNVGELAVRMDWTLLEVEVVGTWLDANEKTLAALRRATRGEAYFEPLPQDKTRLHDAVPLMDAPIRFMRLVALEANRHARDRRWGLAYAWNERLRQMAKHMYQQPLVIQQMLAMGMQRKAVDQLVSWLSVQPPANPRKLAEEIAELGGERCPDEVTGIAESLFSLDYYEEIHAWARAPEEHAMLGEQLAVMFGSFWKDLTEVLPGPTDRRPYKSLDEFREAVKGGSLDHTWEVYGEISKLFERWQAAPFHESWREVETFRQQVAALAKSDPVLAQTTSLLDPDTYDFGWAMTRTQRNALLCVIAVLDYQRREGKLPEKLVDACKALPCVDSTDLFSGEALRYQVNRSGTEFRLYSVGSDGDDDGAEHNGFTKEDGDFVYWPWVAPERYEGE